MVEFKIDILITKRHPLRFAPAAAPCSAVTISFSFSSPLSSPFSFSFLSFLARAAPSNQAPTRNAVDGGRWLASGARLDVTSNSRTGRKGRRDGEGEPSIHLRWRRPSVRGGGRGTRCIGGSSKTRPHPNSPSERCLNHTTDTATHTHARARTRTHTHTYMRARTHARTHAS